MSIHCLLDWILLYSSFASLVFFEIYLEYDSISLCDIWESCFYSMFISPILVLWLKHEKVPSNLTNLGYPSNIKYHLRQLEEIKLEIVFNFEVVFWNWNYLFKIQLHIDISKSIVYLKIVCELYIFLKVYLNYFIFFQHPLQLLHTWEIVTLCHVIHYIWLQ